VIVNPEVVLQKPGSKRARTVARALKVKLQKSVFS